MHFFFCLFLETMDFSSMTLTQIKRQEMDAQVNSRKIQSKSVLKRQQHSDI